MCLVVVRTSCAMLHDSAFGEDIEARVLSCSSVFPIMSMINAPFLIESVPRATTGEMKCLEMLEGARW